MSTMRARRHWTQRRRRRATFTITLPEIDVSAFRALFYCIRRDPAPVGEQGSAT